MAKGKIEDKLIPRKLMPEGIELCKQNIVNFLSEAQLILATGRVNHAYVMVEFAIEELGKIQMLKEALKLQTIDPVIVKGKVFSSHEGKSEKAWAEVLDRKYRLLFDEGLSFSKRFFERGLFVENTEASHRTRCECAFVDFSANRWIPGCDIKKELLQSQIDHIREKLQKV